MKISVSIIIQMKLLKRAAIFRENPTDACVASWSYCSPVAQNAPADDDYEVVEINLVARGFVVLAFDPIGQGERMQFADIPQGEPSSTAPWSQGVSGATLWGSTVQHEYMGK